MIQVALKYAAAGWPMLAVSRTKGPLCEHGVHSATTDPPELRRMWAREPEANPAVRCERFWVLDVDPRNGGHHVLERWEATQGPMPHTWEAITGGGGLHRYFEHDEALDEIPLGKLVEGVDIKGGGRHYVLVPPSVSKSGAYRWRNRPSQTLLAKAPRWLINLIVDMKRVPVTAPVDTSRYRGIDRVERARAYARTLDPAIEGQNGSGATWVAAMKVGRGFALSEDEAYAVLTEEWNARCDPPWRADDLRRQVRNALQKGSMAIGELLAVQRRAS